MRTSLLVSVLFLLVVAAGVAHATATIDVSGNTHLTANADYDRNPSIIHGASDYWLFWTKGDNGGVRGVGGYDPDSDTYVVWYKTAATLAGLEAASETKLALSETSRPANFDQRVVSATYFNNKIYAFVSSGQSGLDRGLYYYEYSGTWSGPVTLIPDNLARGGHVNVTTDGTNVYIVWESSTDASSDFYAWDGTTLYSKVDISTDNMPKITVMTGNLYVASIEDGTGDIEVHSAGAGTSPFFSPHSTAIPGVGLYDPCIFNDGTDLFVVTAPYDGGNDQQYLTQARYSGGVWSTARVICLGGYGGSYWWDYWPIGYNDGASNYLFFTTETGSPSFSDAEIAMIEMDWDLANDHYFYIQNAIDEATATTINIANGTYTEALTITDKGLTLAGESEAGVIVQADVTQTGSENVFTINASGYDVTIQDMTIRNGDYGIRSSAGNVNVLRCTFYHNGWDGTPFPDPPTQANCLAHYATYATSGGAMRIENSAASEIAHCTVYTNDRGIRFQDGTNGDIHDNLSYDNIQAGIYLAASSYTGATGCSDTDVYDNEVYGNRNNGLLSIGGINNTFTNNNVHDNWNSGVMLWHVADNTIEGNTISGNNIYAFNGQGNNGDAYGGVYAEGVDSNAGATFVFKLVGNEISNNLAGAAGSAIGVRIDESLPAYGMEVESNVFTGQEIDVHVRSQAATTTVNFNAFSGTTYGVLNDDVSATLNAEMNWWGDASGPSGSVPGTGAPVSTYVDYTPWIGMTGGENIVCVPDPQVFTVVTPADTVAVRYLGGGEGLLYGYSLSVTWDDAKATLTSVTEDSLLSREGSTVFQVTGDGNSRTIDCALLGGVDGVTGPGDMFTLNFTGTGCGESVVDVTVLAVRDKNNAALSGFYEEDGQLQIDVIAPAVSNVLITNSTLAHTNDYVKDTDSLVVVADVSDGCDYGTLELSDIGADLSDLLASGGTNVNPDTYGGGVATWTLNGVTLTADGLKTVTVTATDQLGNQGTGSDQIIVDNTAPEAVSGFDAAPGHNKVELGWSDATGTDDYFAGVMVRRVGWADYPDYGIPAPDYPATAASDDSVYAGTATSTTDSFTGATRDIYYYQAFAYDEARNYGPADPGAQDRSTSYWLGDVRPVGPGFDGQVATADIDALGTTYGYAEGDIDFENHCDVGPTDTGSRVGIPTPDNRIDFEDLMIFAMNFGVVTPLQGPGIHGDPEGGEAAWAGLRLAVPLSVGPGGEFVATVELEDEDAAVQGLGFAVSYDARAMELREVTRGSLVAGYEGAIFFKVLDGEAGDRTTVDVSVAALGSGETLGGGGDVVHLRFRSRAAGATGLALIDVRLRDIWNQELSVAPEGSGEETGPGLEVRSIPSRLFFRAGQPNPLRGGTALSFGLPAAGYVKLGVHDVTGKLVATLAEGERPAGEHTLVWTRQDDTGRNVPAGIYFARLQARGRTLTQKLVIIE